MFDSEEVLFLAAKRRDDAPPPPSQGLALQQSWRERSLPEEEGELGSGFELLDFPCNQFGQQAPGTDEEIHSFCVHNYKTAFPQFAKVDVKGENAAPLFRYLTDSAGFEGFPQDGKLAPILEKMLGEADPDYAKKPSIKWNFTKFLVGKDGRVIRRFEPTAPLADVEKAIVDAMQAK